VGGEGEDREQGDIGGGRGTKRKRKGKRKVVCVHGRTQYKGRSLKLEPSSEEGNRGREEPERPKIVKKDLEALNRQIRSPSVRASDKVLPYNLEDKEKSMKGNGSGKKKKPGGDAPRLQRREP